MQVLYYAVAIVGFLLAVGGGIAAAKVGLIRIDDHEVRIRAVESVYADIAEIKNEIQNQGEDITEIKSDVRELRQNE